MSNPSPQQLRNILADYFSLGELRSLSFDLGIDYENLEGGSKPGKALALVTYAQRHGRYADLVNAVRQARPRLNLDAPADLPPSPGGQPPASGGAPINIHVEGDLVQGDKKMEGDKITVGDITNSKGVAIGRGASAVVTINTMPPVDDPTKRELESLIAELNAALQQIPENRAEEGEAVAAMTKSLIENAAAEKPNKAMMKISGEGLKQAAKNIADIMPTVLGIATKIVGILLP